MVKMHNKKIVFQIVTIIQNCAFRIVIENQILSLVGAGLSRSFILVQAYYLNLSKTVGKNCTDKI